MKILERIICDIANNLSNLKKCNKCKYYHNNKCTKTKSCFDIF